MVSLVFRRVSIKWSLAVQQYDNSFSRDSGLQWTSLFIAALWRYSKMLWRFRNEVVHGATVEEQVNLQLGGLQEKIKSFYQSYAIDSSMVLARHQFLFTTHTVDQRILGSYDSMAAWIRSVEEAILVLRYHEEALRASSGVFFPSQQVTDGEATDTDSTYSVTDHTTVSSLSLTPTESTQATTNTLFSGSSSSGVIVEQVYSDSSDSYYYGNDDGNSLSSIGSSLSSYSITLDRDVESTSVASLPSGNICKLPNDVAPAAYSLDAYTTSTCNLQSSLHNRHKNSKSKETKEVQFSQSFALAAMSPITRVVLPSVFSNTQFSGYSPSDSMTTSDVEVSSVASHATRTLEIDTNNDSGLVDVEPSSVASLNTRSHTSLSSKSVPLSGFR